MTERSTVVDVPTQQRSTRQRRAVSAILDDLDGFASAQQIHDQLVHRGEKIGLSTVYRNLQALVDAALVDALRNDEGEVLYRRCAAGHHHHHLVCRSCGRTIEVEGAAVERWADAVATEHGFVDVEHTVEVFGTCASCAR
ncbi:MAG: Fur family transcriptional regulator [Aeromicrobium erythreum]